MVVSLSLGATPPSKERIEAAEHLRELIYYRETLGVPKKSVTKVSEGGKLEEHANLWLPGTKAEFEGPGGNLQSLVDICSGDDDLGSSERTRRITRGTQTETRNLGT